MKKSPLRRTTPRHTAIPAPESGITCIIIICLRQSPWCSGAVRRSFRRAPPYNFTASPAGIPGGDDVGVGACSSPQPGPPLLRNAPDDPSILACRSRTVSPATSAAIAAFPPRSKMPAAPLAATASIDGSSSDARHILRRTPTPSAPLHGLRRHKRLERGMVVRAFRHVLIASSWGSADLRS